METNKALVCEPLKDGVLLVDRIREVKPKRVLIIFWHGVGDTVMFLTLFRDLMIRGLRRACREELGWPADEQVHFTLGLPLGLTHEQVVPDDLPVMLLTGEQVNETAEDLDFDLVAKITFPMSESQTELTKAEYCCKHELGIAPIWGYEKLRPGVNRIVAVHYQITCLPGSCNPDRDTAERVWNDILAAGFIPIECHFQHVFHNPVNEKFDFIDASVRRVRPQVSSLVGLIEQARAFIGVVSGPFHVALATLPPDRVFLLEKDFKAECFTKRPIAKADLRNYQGEVKAWLEQLEALC